MLFTEKAPFTERVPFTKRASFMAIKIRLVQLFINVICKHRVLLLMSVNMH